MITSFQGGTLRIADPVKVGVVHPAVAALATAAMRAGWRVSSIIRPNHGPGGSESHSKGIALDVCPLNMTIGGYGPRTALAMWCLAKEVAPHFTWFSLAENDHVHIQLADRDFLGIQIDGHPHRYFTPDLKEITNMNTSEIRRALLNGLPAGELPAGPIGSPITEAGDIVLFSETGDFEEGDDEIGAPKRRRAQKAVAKARASGRVDHKSFSAVHRASGAAQAQQVVRAAQEGALNRPEWVLYEQVEHAVMLQSALGPGAKLRAREITPLLNKLVDFPSVQPRVLSMAWDALTSTWNIDVDVALNTVLGIATGTPVPYLGGIITFPVSQLNQADNLQVTVSRALGPDITLTNTLKLQSKGGTPALCFINGQIISGAPRLHSPVMSAVASTATNPYKLSVSGLTSSYNPQLRLFTPGDTETEKFFSLLA